MESDKEQITLKVTKKELDKIINNLAQLKWIESNELILKITAQYKEQQNKE